MNTLSDTEARGAVAFGLQSGLLSLKPKPKPGQPRIFQVDPAITVPIEIKRARRRAMMRRYRERHTRRLICSVRRMDFPDGTEGYRAYRRAHRKAYLAIPEVKARYAANKAAKAAKEAK